MARLSIRSFVGVGSFMLSGILTATICDMNGLIFQHLHLDDSEMDASVYLPNRTSVIVSSTIGSIVMVAAILGFVLRKQAPDATDAEKLEQENNKRKLLPAMASAFLFSIGLVVSQMTLFSKIYGFLNMNLISEGTWDPTLLMVMGGGFVVSFLSYQWVQGFNLFKVRTCVFSSLICKESKAVLLILHLLLCSIMITELPCYRLPSVTEYRMWQIQCTHQQDH